MRSWKPAIPALVPAAAVLGLWLIYDVSLGDALIFSGYQLAYLIVPGWLVYRAIVPRGGSVLRQFAIGWALGHVVEILAFIALGAIGLRELVWFFPLLVGGAALLVIHRRAETDEPAPPEPETSRAWAWGLAAICTLAAVYVAAAFFASTPFPGRAAIYFPDFVYHVSLAEEARNHWPITEPAAAGEDKPYHWFVHAHIGAASKITGIDVPVVFFRLYVMPLFMLFVTLVAVAGRTLTRSAWAGLIAAALAVFVGEIDLDHTESPLAVLPFLGTLFDSLVLSPSVLLAAVFLVPLFLLIGELLDPGLLRGRAALPLWILVALFAVGASDAKVSALPVVLGGLAIVLAWHLVRSRGIDRTAAIAAGVVAAVALGLYLIQYTGESGSLELHPFASIGIEMPAVRTLEQHMNGVLDWLPLSGTVVEAGGALFGFLALLGAVAAGIAWLLWLQRGALSPALGWLLAVFGAGLILTELLVQPGAPTGMYFLFHAYPAGCILAGYGLWLAGARYGPPIRERLPRFAPLALAWLVAFGLLMAAPTAFDLFEGDVKAVVHSYMLWYGGLAALLAALFAAARLLGAPNGPAALLVTGALVAAAAVGLPIDYEPQLRQDNDPNLTAAELPAKGVTPDKYEGLRWIADNTDEDDVLAVNNHWNDLTNVFPSYAYYSAFSGRRVYLEGWFYTAAAQEDVQAVQEGRLESLRGPARARRRRVRGGLRGDRRARGARRRLPRRRHRQRDRPPAPGSFWGAGVREPRDRGVRDRRGG